MSETLLALLLVTSSAKGSSLVYHWPPSPESSPRLARPRPSHDVTCAQGDNPWRAANALDSHMDVTDVCPGSKPRVEDEDYIWKRPNKTRRRSLSVSHSRSHPTSRRTSPSKDESDSFTLDAPTDTPPDDEYDNILGFSAELLAGLLCPSTAMCHQRFGLTVDDLAFVGHPVCAEPGGAWTFKSEKPKPISRGRVSKKGDTPQPVEKSLTPENIERTKRSFPNSSWLQTFHFVLVFDRPDPSSSLSGNTWKYFDTIYEQIAFTFTAVLYQEQVLHQYVESECDILGPLKDEYIKRGELFADYMSEALKVSSLASAMKTLYDSIKECSIARLTINGLPLELQLPPYLDALLHVEEDCEADDPEKEDEYSLPNPWGDVSFARRLPALTPWKGLLRMDDDDERGYKLYMRLRAPQLTEEDRELAEQLVRFLDLASITLSLADMASLLDWDLENQIYPTVRWLVHHRRAKLVDIVHHELKTVFAVPQKLSAPLPDLINEFDRTFSHVGVPPLVKILSMVSMATHKQSPNHFYATVVGSKDLVPLYHDVVIWMLKRELLITLHLRIRIVATEELKDRVRMEWEIAHARRERIQAREKSREGNKEQDSQESQQRDVVKIASIVETTAGSSPSATWFSLSPKSARRQTRQLLTDVHAEHSQSSIMPHLGVLEKRNGDDEDDFASSGAEDVKWEDWYHGGGSSPYSSMISDPARATPLERRWLAAMSEGKEAYIARRFEQINQYFDGKCTDDEILFKAEITRKQLREVLHHYDEYLETFLHPS